VYDQWNPVLVLDGNNDIQRKYTWGLDLSGTMRRAGGVGGLLSVVETQDTATTADDENYWFVYDGNGNVGQVLDATDTSNVSLAAHYEYDPYGDTLVVDDVDSSGYADDNPYRFSTKWLDDELTTGDNNGGAIESSGLYYYGFRYYSPNLGRWMSRDPLAEKFELNMYWIVNNNSINNYDLYGALTVTCTKTCKEKYIKLDFSYGPSFFGPWWDWKADYIRYETDCPLEKPWFDKINPLGSSLWPVASYCNKEFTTWMPYILLIPTPISVGTAELWGMEIPESWQTVWIWGSIYEKHKHYKCEKEFDCECPPGWTEE